MYGLRTETTKQIKFLGVKTFSSIITKTDNKDRYIQFIGDSMVDYDNSFAHKIGDVLGWEYSVVGDTLPTTSVTRAPDAFVLFLGTDAINANSSQTDINNFVSKYTTLANDIHTKYPNATIYVFQSFANSSNASNVSARNSAISSAVTAIRNNGISVSIINLGAWNVEFDISVSTEQPTVNGDYTVTLNLSKLLLQYSGSSHAALVNDIAEAKKFVGDMGDDEYVHYTD